MSTLAGIFKPAGIFLAICVVFLGVLIFDKISTTSAETIKERANRAPLVKMEAALVKQLENLEKDSLTDFMRKQYSDSELYDIGKKYFVYDLSVSGTDINSGNTQLNLNDSQLEIVITENIKDSDFPAEIIKEISLLNKDKFLSAPPVTITSTKSAYTEKTEYFTDRTVASYLFKAFENDEIISVTINNPDIVKSLGLETNEVKIFVKHK